MVSEAPRPAAVPHIGTQYEDIKSAPVTSPRPQNRVVHYTGKLVDARIRFEQDRKTASTLRWAVAGHPRWDKA